MFPIVVNDGQTPFPEDDIFYIVCKEGVYLKKRLGVMDSIAPVDNISILQSIQTSANMHIRKIPAKLAQQIINFFKAVYAEHYAEAIVLLFYDQERKHHKIVCPFQKVNSSAADYNKGITIEGYDMIGTIHSHAAMSAFHSGVDDDDEKSFDGLHITFGNMKDDDISISASIVANGHRVIVDPREYINQLDRTIDIDEEVKVPYAKTWKWDKEKSKMVEIQTGKYYTRRQFDQRYRVRLSRDPKFNQKWMDRVEKKAWRSHTTYGHGNWADGFYGHGAHYGVGEYWKDWRGHQKIQGKKPDTNLPVVATQEPFRNKSTTTEKAENAETPCDACTFRHHKINFMLDKVDDDIKAQIIKWALEKMDKDATSTINASLGEDSDDLAHYECVVCHSRFSVDESTDEDAVCPQCECDDYLIEITATQLLMGDDESQPSDEEIEANDLNMIDCKSCSSSFTKDFMVAGECPTCGTVLDVEAKELADGKSDDTDIEDEIFIKCPGCDKDLKRVELHFDTHCIFCGYQFTSTDMYAAKVSTEEINEEIINRDSGIYLNPDAEAIQKAIEADKDLERIPVPGIDSIPINKRSRKPGVFANLFQRRNKKI